MGSEMGEPLPAEAVLRGPSCAHTWQRQEMVGCHSQGAGDRVLPESSG